MKDMRFFRAIGVVLLVAGLVLMGRANLVIAGQEKNLDSSVKNIVEHKLQKHKVLVGSNIQVIVET